MDTIFYITPGCEIAEIEVEAVEALRVEARGAGDEDMVAICDLVLDYDAEAAAALGPRWSRNGAIAECARVIAVAAAAAMRDD